MLTWNGGIHHIWTNFNVYVGVMFAIQNVGGDTI